KHGRTLCRCSQELMKFPENMRTNDFRFVCRGQPAVGVLTPEYVEVVEPEVGHHFLKLPFTLDGAGDLLSLQGGKNLTWWCIGTLTRRAFIIASPYRARASRRGLSQGERLQLLFDVSIDTDLLNMFDQPGPRA